jgi:hypothetical protein
MNPTPSPYLPSWALEWFNAQRPRFDDPEEMPHRRAAFYRLLCAEKNNRSMRKMWERVDHHVIGDWDRDSFLGVLIYSTDDALEDERRPLYSPPRTAPETRLRNPAQRQARKLARLLRELFIVTPPRCLAYSTPELKFMGGTVERLVIAYGFDLALDDLNEIYRRHGIEYTGDSKRGWLQRRRASDAVRIRVIEAARKLAEIGRARDGGFLQDLADALQRLPDFKTEHTGQPELRSQKCGWADWIRVAHHDLSGVASDNCLRVVDWTALVRALFDDVDVSEVRVGQVLKESA